MSTGMWAVEPWLFFEVQVILMRWTIASLPEAGIKITWRGWEARLQAPPSDFDRSQFAFQINTQVLLLLLVQADTLRNTVLGGMEVNLGEKNRWLRSVGSRIPGPHSIFPLFYFHRLARATWLRCPAEGRGPTAHGSLHRQPPHPTSPGGPDWKP